MNSELNLGKVNVSTCFIQLALNKALTYIRYVKEFVHGDFGRTSPNMCSLLDAECDILQLDVTVSR